MHYKKWDGNDILPVNAFMNYHLERVSKEKNIIILKRDAKQYRISPASNHVCIMVNKNNLGTKRWRGQEKQRLKGMI